MSGNISEASFTTGSTERWAWRLCDTSSKQNLGNLGFGERVRLSYVGWKSLQTREIRLQEDWVKSLVFKKDSAEAESWKRWHKEWLSAQGAQDTTMYHFELFRPWVGTNMMASVGKNRFCCGM